MPRARARLCTIRDLWRCGMLSMLHMVAPLSVTDRGIQSRAVRCGAVRSKPALTTCRALWDTDFRPGIGTGFYERRAATRAVPLVDCGDFLPPATLGHR